MKIWLATSITLICLALCQGCGNAPPGPDTTGTLAETIIDAGTPACDTLFYNNEYGYGFDLPAEADLLATEGLGRFFRAWAITFGQGRIGISTAVHDAPPGSLSEYVLELVEVQEAEGSTILEALPISLPNGTDAYFTSSIDPSVIGSDRFVRLIVRAIVGEYFYYLAAFILIDDYSDTVDIFIVGLLNSLCFTGSAE